MIGSDMPAPSQSLTERVKNLETQIVLRQQNIATVVTGFKRKITVRMASPGSLLAAFGIGIVIEQANHHRDWSVATVIDTASAGIRLLLSFTSALQSSKENSKQAPAHGQTQQ